MNNLHPDSSKFHLPFHSSSLFYCSVSAFYCCVFCVSALRIRGSWGSVAQLLSETEGFLINCWRVVRTLSSHQYCLCATKSGPSTGKSVWWCQWSRVAARTMSSVMWKMLGENDQKQMESEIVSSVLPLVLNGVQKSVWVSHLAVMEFDFLTLAFEVHVTDMGK